MHTRLLPRALAVGLAATGASTAVALAPLSARAGTAATTGSALQLASPAWGGIGTQTPAQVAASFGVVAGNFDSSVDQFHTANPATLVLKYQLGPYTSGSQCASLNGGHTCTAGGVAYGSGLAHDSTGHLINVTTFPQNFLAEPDSAAWQQAVASQVTAIFTKQPNYDGVLSDSTGLGPFTHYTDAVPIDPATGTAFTPSEWITAVRAHLQAMRSALPAGKLLFLNGLAGGGAYWGSKQQPVGTSQLLAPDPATGRPIVDGAMAENTFRSSSAAVTAWPTATQWSSAESMIEDVQAHGIQGLFWTKCWPGGTSCSAATGGSAALTDQWLRFSLGSYLLAAGGSSHYYFDDDPKNGNSAETYAEESTVSTLGAPLTARAATADTSGASGAWTRAFSNGLVLVNPTSTPHTIAITTPGYDLDGTLLSGTVTLAPESGQVLRYTLGG